MNQLKAYKNHFLMILYIVVFVIFFGLSMQIITDSQISSRTIEASGR